MPDPLHQTISATQAPALLDASPYVTRWMLYRHFAHGDPLPDPQHNRLNWGKILQPHILEAAAGDLHFKIVQNVEDVYVRRGLLGCTRDADIINPDLGPCPIDAKAVFDYATWMANWGGGEKPPREVEIQVQVQMYVGDPETGPAKAGVIAAWCAADIKYFHRKPIPALWKLLEERAAEFFDDVKNGREPDPMGVPIEIPMFNTCFPVVEKKVLDLSAVEFLEGDGLAIETPESKRRIAALESARMYLYHGAERLGQERAEKKLKAELLAIAGDAEEVLLPSGARLKLKMQSRKGFTVEPTSFKTLDVYVPKDVG